MRSKISIEKIASATSNVFYEVGNSLTLSFAGVTDKSSQIQLFLDDNEALAQDWNQVSKEVVVAIDRFGKQYQINR